MGFTLCWISYMDRMSSVFFLWILVISLGLNSRTTAAIADHYRVAGLFESDFDPYGQEAIFKYAVEKMNLNNTVGSGRMIVYDVKEIGQQDSFKAHKEVCLQMDRGIAAVFGPSSKIPRAHVQSICNAFGIPHVQAQWDERDSRDYFSISVYPDHDVLSSAYADLLSAFGWKRFTVIYEDDDGLIRLQEALKATRGPDYKVTIRKLETFSQNSYITMFKDLKDKNEYHIVVDCDVMKVKKLLHEALKVNMLSEYYHFHFTTLDLGLVDLEDYKYSGANITAMRLIDPDRTHVVEFMTDISQTRSIGDQKPSFTGKLQIKTESVLMYDAVHLFAHALRELANAQEIKTEPIICEKKHTWQYGNSLLNYMKAMDFDGLSGRIHVDNGKRVDFNLDIVELTTAGLRTIGMWRPKTGVNITMSHKIKKEEDLSKLANMTLKVVTVCEEPYMICNANANGEMQHEGFMVDLLNLLKTRLKFNYTIYEVADKKFGVEKNGTWNGIVGDLMGRDSAKRADLAAASMSITYEREKVVDFTKPFLNLGITIIYKKPVRAPPDLFSFLSPLSIQVWIYMMAAYVCVSFMLFVIARFSPYEWTNPHPCNEDSELVENQFTILNSLWFTIGSLMQQGCELAPRAISTRVVACIWWFFTLIMISSYTANLAAFLTVERMDSPIASVEDLAQQTKIKYGTVGSGSTSDFFKTSDLPTYKRMWAFMNAQPEVSFVNNSKEGIQRVKTSDYALISESTTIDYQVQRNCDLQQVGGLLDSKGYGIAFPRDSPWTEHISREIIFFQENQEIQKLYTKWWKEKSGGACDADAGKKDARPLGVKHVGGVFVVLVGGLLGGLFIACLEFMWRARKNAKVDKQSFCSEMSEELRFATKCFHGSEMTSRRNTKEIVNNGNQFALLPTMPTNRIQKEVYA